MAKLCALSVITLLCPHLIHFVKMSSVQLRLKYLKLLIVYCVQVTSF